MKGLLLVPMALLATATLMVTSCGGGDQATATPIPATPTAVPPTVAAPTATSTVVSPTATRPPATATPQPTPTPASTIPTPVVVTGGKRGGILATSGRTSYIDAFDTYNTGGTAGVVTHGPLLNNILMKDVYGDGGKIGDAAEAWTFSGDGKVLTFTIRKGISFHDGKPLTAKDVAYNIERAWKPRSPRMIAFKGKLDAIAAVETPDDSTVRLTLSQASNFLLEALALSAAMVYPAHMPLPEFDAEWKQKKIGSGPFRLGNLGGGKLELTRNASYWKPGLPYLDGIVITAIDDDALIISGYRTGKLYANSIDMTALQDVVLDGTLQREVGWTTYNVVSTMELLQFNQAAPWTDARVREALDLAIDRRALVSIVTRNVGNPLASPLLPTNVGGRWAIPEQEMDIRPGFRKDKTADLARAKQLLKDAGIDPAALTIRFLAGAPASQAQRAEVIDGQLREIGLKSQLILLEPAQKADSELKRSFDVDLVVISPGVEDPLDSIGTAVKTGGAFNFAQWSNPAIDRILAEQDRELDPQKRARLLRDLQDLIMNERTNLMVDWSYRIIGHSKIVKNFPKKVSYLFDPRFRWEQVWLEQ